MTLKPSQSGFTLKDDICKKVAVLGAGTMGAQIAAHFANANIPCYLFDLPSTGKDHNAISQQAIKKLLTTNPAPLATPETAQLITAANYKQDLELLKTCDLVIEAVVEDLKIKQKLFAQIGPHLNKQVVLASNTSGLNIDQISHNLPSELKSRFLGMHFFNPPRYMPLVELIPSQKTKKTLLPEIESFLVTRLGKSIIYAKDTPNFVANRIGSFSLLLACHYAKAYKLELEVVDQLTGKRLGRPKSATFRTLDVVGLDVLAHVVATMQQLKTDPWHSLYQVPDWIQTLIDQGALGAKTKRGIYEKTADGLKVLNLKNGKYRLADAKADKAVTEILKQKDPAKRFAALYQSKHPQAQFLWACFRETFRYCAYCARDIAELGRDIDLAMRWGFGWDEGPLELWQNIGWSEVIAWIDQDIQAGKTLSDQALPDWVRSIKGCYQNNKSFNFCAGKMEAIKQLPVYQRQLFPDLVLDQSEIATRTLYENEGLSLWTCGNDGVGIISFKTKMCIINEAVLDGLVHCLKLAEETLLGLIIWQKDSGHFSAGADLMGFAESFMLGGAEALKPHLIKFQQTVLAVRYAKIPVVAAVRGYVFGGGCELMMHCDQVVAALESYIGLVEVGVGIVPGAGGCKEMALRAAQSKEPLATIQDYYKNIAMANPATSAAMAKDMDYLRPSDMVVLNANEILYVAKQQLKALASKPYQPPRPPQIPVLGVNAIAMIEMFLANMQAGGYVSEHDILITTKLAIVMCGGELYAGTKVDEDWYLRLEREAFLALVEMDKTQARVQHMLETGRPLRN